MDNRLIFLYPSTNDGVTEKASLSRLMDFGSSAIVVIQANPYNKAKRDEE